VPSVTPAEPRDQRTAVPSRVGATAASGAPDFTTGVGARSLRARSTSRSDTAARPVLCRVISSAARLSASVRSRRSRTTLRSPDSSPSNHALPAPTSPAAPACRSTPSTPISSRLQ
jgi:hypothetical protein